MAYSLIFNKCILIAPGGRFEETDLSLAQRNLKNKFKTVSYIDLKPDGYFSGSLAHRKSQLEKALNEALVSKEMNWIMAVRGGYGAFDLVEKFSSTIINKEIILSGFSDISVLLNQQQDNPSFYPVYGMNAIASFANPVSDLSMRHFDQIINKFEEFSYEEDVYKGISVISSGEAKGEIFGGCLSVLMTLIGTKYFPNLDGKILFLEDINEPVYKLDRMLKHLQAIGVLDRIIGVILGDFHGCDSQFSVTPYDIFLKYFSKMKYPVIAGFPMGHGKNQVPVKFKWPVHFRADNKGDVAIEYLLLN